MNKKNIKIGTITLIVIIVGYIIYATISASNYDENLSNYPSENQMLNDIEEDVKSSLGYASLEGKKLSDKFNPKNGSISDLKQKKESEKELTITGYYTYKTDIYTYKDKIEIYYNFDGKKYKYNFAHLVGEGSVEIYLTECKENYKDKLEDQILEKYPSFTTVTFSKVERNDDMSCSYNYTTSDGKKNYDVTAKVTMGCDPLGECSYWISYDRTY